VDCFITGTAGFIGFHLAKLLLEQGHTVHGYDGITDYYDVRLKHARHNLLRQYPQFTATEAMLEDDATLPLQHRAPAQLHRRQHHRQLQRHGGRAPPAGGAPADGLHLVRLRRQHRDAV